METQGGKGKGGVGMYKIGNVWGGGAPHRVIAFPNEYKKKNDTEL